MPGPLTADLEVAQLLADHHKHVVGDLHWRTDDAGGHDFVAPVRSTTGELVVRGQRCPAAGSLRFALVLRGVGRILALDLGHTHLGPDGRSTGELHLHRWQPGHRDRLAETPTPHHPADLHAAWQLFCRLARLTHDGQLSDPPPAQETLL
ncbi:MAG: hypothetical protein IPO88_07820 [Nannocystis sp.]|uniref:hypothetical protein n=1 Tax=Nannocystis sp. TaxID=1962667 RepID=UPI002425BE79|nr:hypothetical protein [Nannocystis sp.]MBK9753403.1 hypothetical protein [Nannocystis sp.]